MVTLKFKDFYFYLVNKIFHKKTLLPSILLGILYTSFFIYLASHAYDVTFFAAIFELKQSTINLLLPIVGINWILLSVINSFQDIQIKSK